MKTILEVKGNVAAVSNDEGAVRYVPVHTLDPVMLETFMHERQRLRFTGRLIALLKCDQAYADQQWESLTDSNKARPYDAARLCALAHRHAQIESNSKQ